MEKKNTKHNNKKKYRLIKKPIPLSARRLHPFAPSFCKFKTKRENFTNHKQLDDKYICSTERFCLSTSLPVKKVGCASSMLRYAAHRNKSTPQQDYSFFLTREKQEQEGATSMRLFQAHRKENTSMRLLLSLTAHRRDNTLPITRKGGGKAKMQLEQLKKKFINLLMRDGEKSKAYKLFADSLKQVEEKKVLENTTLKVFDFFTARKKHLCDLDQKQYKQKKEKKLESLNDSHRVKQDYYNSFLRNNILYQAVENVKPALELKRVRKGGTTYQVPAIVSQKRQERLAIKWIIEAAKKKKKKNNKSFSNCLVSEILDAFNKTGQPRQRRDEQLKVAEFNRAYTRYRWW